VYLLRREHFGTVCEAKEQDRTGSGDNICFLTTVLIKPSEPNSRLSQQPKVPQVPNTNVDVPASEKESEGQPSPACPRARGETYSLDLVVNVRRNGVGIIDARERLIRDGNVEELREAGGESASALAYGSEETNLAEWLPSLLHLEHE